MSSRHLPTTAPEPPRPTGHAGSRSAHAFEERYFPVLAGFILILAVGLRYVFFTVTDFRGDEIVYLRYAERISAHGLPEFHELAEEYASTQSLWEYPPPLRVLYISVVALACWLVGACSGPVAASVSLASGTLLVALALLMARRLFGEKVALLSGLLVAVAPLQLQLSRRALQDAFFSLAVLLAIWAFWERTRSLRKGWDVLLGCALVAALLTKESAVVLPLFFLAALLWPTWVVATDLGFHRSTLAAALLPLPIAVLIFLALVRDPWLLMRVYTVWLSAPETNQYVIKYMNGPWFRYLIDFALLSPLVVTLAIGSYFTATQDKAHRFLGRLCLLLLLIFCLLPQKNIRFVSFLDLPIRMLTVVALGLAFQRTRARIRHVGFATAVVLLAAYDLYLFYTLFIGGMVYDPVTATIGRALGVIP